MTGQPRFCGSCGAGLPPGVRFCPGCGHPVEPGAVAAPPAAPPPAVQPTYQPTYQPSYEPGHQPTGQAATWPAGEVWEQGPVRRSGSRRPIAFVAGGVAVLAVAGVVATTLLLGGGGSVLLGSDSGRQLASAVTSEPERQWSWRGSSITGAVAAGDLTVIGAEEGGSAVALDESGEEVWSVELSAGAYLSPARVPGRDDIVLTAAWEAEGIGALSTDAGEELWSFDDGYLVGLDERGVYYSSEDEFGLLDVETGDELWSRSAPDSYAFAQDAVYVLDNGELSRLSTDSGDEQWSVDVELGPDQEYVSMSATEGLVVVGAGDVVAFDADGEELWTESKGVDDVTVGVYSDDSVYVVRTDYDYDAEGSDTSVTVYDGSGERGELDVDAENYFYAQGFTSGGTAYALDHSSGTLFDDQLEEVGQYDGSLTIVDGGIYAWDSEDGELAFYKVGESSPEWRVSTLDGDTLTIEAGDDRIVVVTDDEVTEYR